MKMFPKKLERSLKKIGFKSERYDGNIRWLVFYLKPMVIVNVWEERYRKIVVLKESRYYCKVDVWTSKETGLYNFRVPDELVIPIIEWIKKYDENPELLNND